MYHVSMKQRQIRLTEHDDKRLEARANAAGVSVPQWMRELILRELNGIEPATVLRQEFARETAEIRIENERYQTQIIELLVAFRDSLRNSQTELLEGFREAISGKTGGQSGLLNKLQSRSSTP